MSALLKIVDDHFGREGRVDALPLRLASERVTGREIIERRVRAEIAHLRAEQADRGRAVASYLVAYRRSPVERLLNGARRQSELPRGLAWDETAEVERAIAAFAAGRYLLFVDDRQIDDLETPLTLSPDSEATFLRLTPLIGG